MWAALAILDCGIVFFAVLTIADAGDDLHLHFAVSKKLSFLLCPFPAIGQIVGYHGGNLTNLNRYAMYGFNIVFAGHFFQRVHYGKDYSKFMHIIYL